LRIADDNKKLFEHLFNEKLIPSWVFRMHFSENKTERRFLRLIHNPKSYFIRFLPKKVKGYEGIDFDINKLKKILEQ